MLYPGGFTYLHANKETGVKCFYNPFKRTESIFNNLLLAFNCEIMFICKVSVNAIAKDYNTG